MEDFARRRRRKKDNAVENLASSKYDFAEDLEDVENVEGDQESIDWMLGHEADSKGRYLSSAQY
jgi:hypothetical protein